MVTLKGPIRCTLVKEREESMLDRNNSMPFNRYFTECFLFFFLSASYMAGNMLLAGNTLIKTRSLPSK